MSGSRRSSRRRLKVPAPPSAPPRTRPASLWQWAPLVAFVASLVWRLAYLGRLATTPLAGTLRGDEQGYWIWARFLADHGFVGTNPFFQGPLYPYTLAVLQTLGFERPEQVLVVQAFWGACGVAALADAMRRIAGGGPALFAGLVVSTNVMWNFFDARLLSESLLLALECSLLWVWSLRATLGHSLRFAVISGVLIGLMAQCRATQILLVVPHLILIRALQPPGRRFPSREMGVAAACLLLMLVPSTLWNWSKTGAFVPFTYNGGLNLYVGNNPMAEGGFVWVDGARRLGTLTTDSPDGSVDMDGREYLERTLGSKLTPLESSAYWASRAREYARSHPLRTLELALRKVLLMVNRVEVPQIEHLDTYQKLAGPVGLPLVGEFWFLLMLAGLGVLHRARAPALTAATGAYVLTLILSIAPFFVTDRYRVHLVPGLAVLAGLGLGGFWGAVTSGGGRALFKVALCCGLTVALTSLPLGAVDARYETWLALSDEGVRWLEAGRARRAVETFEAAVRQESELLRRGWGERTRAERAELSFNYGVALRQTGDRKTAIERIAAAAALAPDHARYVRALGDAYLVEGRTREADSLLRRVQGLVGGAAESDLSRGYQYARAGDFAAAAIALDSAVARDARLYGAWGALIRVHVLAGDLVAAERTLHRATAVGMPRLAQTAYRGWIAAARGDSAVAAAALAEVAGLELDPLLSQVVQHTRELLRSRESERRPAN